MLRAFMFILIALIMLVPTVFSAPAYSSEESDDLFVLTPLKGSHPSRNSLVVRKSESEFIPLYKYKQETHKRRRVNNGHRPSYIEEAEFPTLA